MRVISANEVEENPTIKNDSGFKYKVVSPDEVGESDSHSSWQNIYLKTRPFLKGTAEGVGMVGGGALGAGAGVFGGGPIGAIAGGVAGGALGYAGGKASIDILDKAFGVAPNQSVPEMVKQTGKDIVTGAELEMGGRTVGAGLGLAGKGISKIKKIIPPTSGRATQIKAGNELISQGSDLLDTQIEANIKAAKELESKIPGLKFTRGQITNDAQAIALERSLIRSGTRIDRGKFSISGADLNQEQKAFAEKALQDYYNKQLTAGGKVSDFTDVLANQKATAEAGLNVAKDKVNVEVNRLGRVIDEQEIGQNIVGRLNPAKQTSQKEASQLYDKIPNVKVGTEVLKERLTEIKKEFDSLVESPKSFPSRIVNGISKKIKDGEEMGFQELRKLRSTILAERRMARSGANPNPQLDRRLGQLQEAVEESIDTQLKDAQGTAGDLYRQASSKYAEYSKKFKQGTVADVLAKGSRGEETKIAMSNIASNFFTKDGLDDFVRAVGNDKLAMDSMRDFARYDMFNKTYDASKNTINPSKAFAWIQKNGKVLEKLGIKKELLETAKTGQELKVSQKNLDLFNNSMAGKILNADPERVVATAFSGSKNYGATAQQLLNMVKGNKAAEEGIKKAVAEHILESSKVTAEGFFTDYKVSNAKLTGLLKKFFPALKVLYKSEPQKIKAIIDVQNAYKIANRNVASPIGGGSDTAENISNILAAAGGARAGQYYLLISIKKAIAKYSDNQVNKYLLKATFDPDYAVNLINMAKASSRPKIDTTKTIKRFDSLMSRLTVLGINERSKNK